MKLIKILFIFILFSSCDTPLFTPKEGYITPFEVSDGKTGASYEETINYYKQLASDYSSIALKTMGKTDSGLPLYLAIFNKDGVFDFNRIQKDKIIILINSGMYSSENEGVDATMLLMRNLAQKQIKIPENIVIVSVPILNYLDFIKNDLKSNNNINTLITRDLENDFIKNESKNSISFSDIFHTVQPDIFIDTRSLKGFEGENRMFYQTIIPEKLNKIKFYLQESFLPQLSDSLKNKSIKIENDSIELNKLELFPYPTSSDIENANTPIGYASLWNTISLKIASQNENNYQNRVENMYNTLKMIILLTNTDFQLIKNLKTQQDNEDIQRKEYTLSFIPDSLSLSEFNFSIISKNKLNNKDSIENVKKIKFFKKYLPKEKIKIPKGYIISKLQTNIIHLLENNKISFNIFDKDSILNATAYEIKSFKHSDSLISGHFPINNVEFNKINTNISVTKGDFFIPTEQKGIKYLLETLEPESKNGFLYWNFLNNSLNYKIKIENDSIKKIIFPIYRIEK